MVRSELRYMYICIKCSKKKKEKKEKEEQKDRIVIITIGSLMVVYRKSIFPQEKKNQRIIIKRKRCQKQK